MLRLITAAKMRASAAMMSGFKSRDWRVPSAHTVNSAYYPCTEYTKS